ncbi:aminotransferase class V-fold PLP-dependent enzyme [Amycolatopsis sp. H20-H5]|uniref:aminotransferase class V-fold PLP-dependent enzyme n=1 Tax=Amycolatopsis sp. H20-H5 TaxID=3046309 RepID=UPI002DC0129D|nr:aminotransferase class V-fold PLP-dependent enzyme [Amycolatopsis sp. H20-H5]MEC3977476.1 aminotransferase class V-fold PLP-dependent enzyme [Amycolatopsis sp. H20-H5]
MHAFGAEFDVQPGYLNTASIGVPPVRVADAVTEAVGRWRRGEDMPSAFDDSVAAARAAFATLAGVPVDRVAIGTTVSQLVSTVAAGLPDGAKVLVAAGEFTSVSFPFAAQAHRGVTVTEADLTDLPARAGDHDVVAVSVVQSANGAQVDLGALRAAAEAGGTAVLLDTSQAAGWLPLALDWADWVVGAGYKWLLCPRGSSWLAVHPRALERTRPIAAGWYAGDVPMETTYGLPLRLAEGARSLDLSPVWFAQTGAAVALPYLASLDLAEVRDHCVGLADSFLKALGREPLGSAIVAVAADPGRLAAAGISSGIRAGKVRVAFHLYNTADDVERLLTAFG